MGEDMGQNTPRSEEKPGLAYNTAVSRLREGAHTGENPLLPPH